MLDCPRCGAKTRSGLACRAPAVRGKRRCRMHGGARGSGAPTGAANGRYRTGRRTREMQELRQRVARLLREAAELV
ncbi:HGGxSTG domain-containing protein [Geminicoccus harenae]|uniref:HGGxSTG domain-containing protein n=1 Tax=Geminicoccus harenae TaxID=2498453 RepID=UPI002795BD40|nr:HGGxSTG domain-containing protein [Geminicoccus harenae]